MNINPSLTRDLAPVIEDVGAPKLPWVPMHPAMIPLSETAIERGLSRIKALRQQFFAKPEPDEVITRDGFAAKWVAPFGKNHIEQCDNINAIADERAEPQVTADIAALSSLDNQKLGLYQYA